MAGALDGCTPLASEGSKTVTQLLALLVIGIAIVAWGLFALFRMPKNETAYAQFHDIEFADFIELRALNFRSPVRLFCDEDYRVLLKDSRLVSIAKRLRRDRRKIALHWLAELRVDVLELWRLRRLLITYGVTQGWVEELETALTAVSIQLCIALLQIGVFTLGPFALVKIVDYVYRTLSRYARSCYVALARLPKAEFAQFSAEWRSREVLAI